ncbi:hypothetical protein LOK49_LG09G01370 [Camellia lanceoleosa]|uniref:Uncharacterized protein n=1 Tax=Camellia lanceoleosa TaxID=1840588 RepID=A0ACC0GIS3_9ERIC|nr:hypothetical protein LOK49_LG09G01370 [Camellia lanceoleosa]
MSALTPIILYKPTSTTRTTTISYAFLLLPSLKSLKIVSNHNFLSRLLFSGEFVSREPVLGCKRARNRSRPNTMTGSISSSGYRGSSSDEGVRVLQQDSSIHGSSEFPPNFTVVRLESTLNRLVELADAYSPDTVIASSPGKEVHDPWAFYLHATLLRQAFAHCENSPFLPPQGMLVVSPPVANYPLGLATIIALDEDLELLLSSTPDSLVVSSNDRDDTEAISGAEDNFTNHGNSSSDRNAPRGLSYLLKHCGLSTAT